MTLVTSEEQRRFGQSKYDTLPKYCKQCGAFRLWHGSERRAGRGNALRALHFLR